jgi:hypothetical protein
MTVQYYRRDDLDVALNLAASFPSYTRVTIKAAGVTRKTEYEVEEGYQWATLSSKAKPKYYSSEDGRDRVEKQDEKFFLPRADFYDVVVNYGK